MSNFLTLETYLEHAGVKGMQWGVRNRINQLRSGGASNRSSGSNKQVKPKMSNRKKALIAVGATVAIGATAYALSKNTKINTISGRNYRNIKYDLGRKFGSGNVYSRKELAVQVRNNDLFNRAYKPFDRKKVDIAWSPRSMRKNPSFTRYR